jgi:hypothetical protein
MDRLDNPSQNRYENPAVYLYQLGYLSIEPYPSEKDFILDYPNTEVKMSKALRLLSSYFNYAQIAGDVCERLNKALTERNPELVVNELNLLLSYIPQAYFDTGKRDESFYCRQIFTLFYALNLYFESCILSPKRTVTVEYQTLYSKQATKPGLLK